VERSRWRVESLLPVRSDAAIDAMTLTVDGQGYLTD